MFSVNFKTKWVKAVTVQSLIDQGYSVAPSRTSWGLYNVFLDGQPYAKVFETMEEASEYLNK